MPGMQQEAPPTVERGEEGIRSKDVGPTLHLFTECQYWYVYQLPLELSCNPYGSELQLQCIATGPSQPGLELQWYSSTSLEGTVAMLKPAALEKGYSIQNIVLGANGMGTASTVLQIEYTEEERAQQCYWCQIAVDGKPATVQGNTLCLLDKSHYTGMPSCSKTKVPIYTTPVCAGPQLPDELATEGVYATIVSTPEEAPNRPPSEEYLHTQTSSTAARTHTRSSPIEEPKMEGSDEGSDNQSTNMDALYAAVAVCVVFVVIILILVVVIVVLCKRRSWRNAISYSSKLCASKARPHSGTDTVLENAFSGPADTRPNSEVEIVTALLNTTHDRSPTKSDFSDTEIRCVNNGRPKRQNRSTDHDYSDIEDIIPAKLEISKDKGIDLDNYDHLEPVEEKEMAPNNQSKERFYYTLDDSDGELSDKASGRDHTDIHSNKLAQDTTYTDGVSDSGDYDEVCHSQGRSLEELFDDPKYAAFLHNARKSHGHKTCPPGGSLPPHSSNSPPPSDLHRSGASPVEKEGSNEPQKDHIIVPIEVHNS